MEDGTLLCMDVMAPKDVRLLANRALMALEASRSSLATRIGGPPDLEPLNRFLNGQRGTKVSASLRALGEGGWWTQQRMFDNGLP